MGPPVDAPSPESEQETFIRWLTWGSGDTPWKDLPWDPYDGGMARATFQQLHYANIWGEAIEENKQRDRQELLKLRKENAQLRLQLNVNRPGF